MSKLLIIGASGHGKVIEDIARLNGYQSVDYLDDRVEELRASGMNVIGTCKDIESFIKEYDFAVGIGDNAIRKKMIDTVKLLNGRLPVLIHPSAVISSSSIINAGTIVMANAVICVGSIINEGCIINTAATIDHECILGECVHISPGAHLAGNVTIGELSWIGIGSCVIQGLKIGNNATIGAGAVIIRECQDYTTMVGNPARCIDKGGKSN